MICMIDITASRLVQRAKSGQAEANHAYLLALLNPCGELVLYAACVAQLALQPMDR